MLQRANDNIKSIKRRIKVLLQNSIAMVVEIWDMSKRTAQMLRRVKKRRAESSSRKRNGGMNQALHQVLHQA